MLKWNEVVVSVMCLVCVLFHGSLYPHFMKRFFSLVCIGYILRYVKNLYHDNARASV